MNNNDKTKAYSIEQVADMLNVDRRSIKKEIEQKKLKAVQIGKIYRIMPEHFQEYTGTASFNQPEAKNQTVDTSGAAKP